MLSVWPDERRKIKSYRYLLLLCCLTAGCATSLPEHTQPPSYSLPARPDSVLSRYVSERQPDPTLSGFALLQSGADALAARLQLIDAAQQSVDLQYYIYKQDRTGALVAERLIAAADRGVRVRLLLDDLGNQLDGERIAALDRHPLIQVRLFNPLTLRQRWLRNVSKVSEFGRINHRMHNKLMIADGRLFITGGRNIGDEYYALSELNFRDLDVLGIGEVSADVARSFDAFWNSHKALPVQILEGRVGQTRLQALRRRLSRVASSFDETAYLARIEASPFRQFVAGDPLTWHWGVAEWIFDPPEKADPFDALNEIPLVGRSLARHASQTGGELLAISAYFIPGEEGTEFLLQLAENDVAVNVLTNSLATTDVLAVHSSYAPYRSRLLAGGVRIWELKAPQPGRSDGQVLFNESTASLHAKAFVFDRERVFIGSINLDPRSVSLNTEAGVLVYQHGLAAETAQLFERWTKADLAYELKLDEGNLVWHGDGQVWTREPRASTWRRLGAWLLDWLPIESQL